MTAVLLALLACSAGTRTWTIDDALEGATLRLATGEVRIVSEARTDAELIWEGASAGLDGPPVVELAAGELEVDGDCETCAGTLWLALPVGVPVAVEVGTGAVAITLVQSANVSACVDRGSVDIAVPAGAYSLQLDAEGGRTEVEGVEHEDGAEFVLEACVGAGDLAIHGE